MIFSTTTDEDAFLGKRITSVFAEAQKTVSQHINAITKDIDTDIAVLQKLSLISEGSLDDYNKILENASSAARDFAKNNDVTAESIANFAKEQKTARLATIAQNTSLSNSKALISIYNDGLEKIGLSQKEFVDAISKSNPQLAKYLNGLNGAEASIGGYTKSLALARVGTLAFQAATIALNTALTMGISVAISKLIEGISYLVNWEEKQYEAAQEAAQAAKEKADASKEEYDTLTDLIARYKELAESEDSDSPETRAEILDLQTQITNIVGQQANNLDLVNGKLDEEIEKLNIIKSTTAEGLVQDTKESYRTASKESEAYTYHKGSWWTDWRSSDAVISFDWHGYDNEIMSVINETWQEQGYGTAYASTKDTFDTFNKLEFADDIDTLPERVEALDAALEAIENDPNFGVLDQYDETYDEILKIRNEMADIIKTQTEAANSYFEALLESEQVSLSGDMTVDSLKSYEDYRQQLIDRIKSDETMSDIISQGFLTDESIETYVDGYLSTLTALSDYYAQWQAHQDGYMTRAEADAYAAEQRVKEQQESLNETKVSLPDLFTLEDEDGSTFSDRIDDYQDKVTRLKEALTSFNNGELTPESLIELQKEFPDLIGHTDDFDSAVRNLLDDLNGEMLLDFLNQFGKLETEEDREKLAAFREEVLALGEVVGSTQFSIDIAAESTGMDNLFTAMKESVSATGLNAESIDNLKERYEDLESYDAARLFERTENGIHLNTKALRELEAEYEKQTKSDIDDHLDDLIEQYNNLSEEIDKTDDAATTADLYAQRQDILDQIDDTAELAAQYEGLTSAFNEWEQAQSIGEEGDMYDSLANGLESIKELYDEGLVGTNKFRTAVQLMTNEDMSTASTDELVEAYEAGYDVMTRYFTDGSDGCLRFLEDVQKLNSEWVHLNEDGSWDIDFGIGEDEEVAEKLGINVESVQAIMRKLSDYGFEINLDSIYSDLELVQTSAEEANEKLIELGETDIRFNFADTDLESLDTQIEQAQSLLDDFRNSDGTINLKLEGAEEARIVLQELLDKKNSIATPDIMKVDTSKVYSGYSTLIDELKSFKTEYENILVGVDTTDAQQKLDDLRERLSKHDATFLATLNIDASATDEEIYNAINQIDNELMLKVGVDAAAVDAFEEKDKDDEADVIYGVNHEAVDAFNKSLPNIYRTVYYRVITESDSTGVSSIINNASSAATRLIGGAKAQGTAFAKGNWGAKDSGVALGGEQGAELVN